MLKNIYHKIWKLVDKVASKDMGVDDGLNKISNLPYGTDPKNNAYDVFMPKTFEEKRLPTIFVIHGGGYIGGEKEICSAYCQMLAKMGCLVINFEYTKCDDESKKYFPDQIYEFFDFYNALKKSQFAKNIDFDNIFLAGDSAGAHIATLVANIQTNPNLKLDFNLTGGPSIKGLILASPSMGIYQFGGLPLKEEYNDLIFGDKKTRNPLSQVTSCLDLTTPNLPPAIMLSVKNDIIVGPHEKMFLKMAKQLGLSVQHYTICSGYKLFHDSMVENAKKYPITMSKIKGFIDGAVNGQFAKGVTEEKIFEAMPKKTPQKTIFQRPKTAEEFAK